MKNAFESVRPRGATTAPAARPPKVTPGQALTVRRPAGPQRVLDARGRLGAPLAPRTHGSVVVENAARGQASADRRAAIKKGGL